MNNHIPNSYHEAIIIGISEYDKLESLDFCRNDGQAMIALLTSLKYDISEKYKMIGRVEYTQLRDNINDFFLDPHLNSKYTLLLYYSGHGVPDIDGDIYLGSSEIDPNRPSRRGFSFEDITKMIGLSLAGKIIIIFDCCYSGAARISKGNERDVTKIASRILSEKADQANFGEGKCILAASQGYQEAFSRKEGNHSLFTYYLIEGLKPNPESVDIDGRVTADSLARYVYNSITNLPIDEKPQQKPIKKVESGGDIILAEYPHLKKKIKKPDKLSMLFEEGDRCFQLGRYDEAINSYDQAIEINPNKEIGWWKKAKAYEELKDRKTAFQCYDKAIELNPNSYTAWYEKGKLHNSEIPWWKIILIWIGLWFAGAFSLAFLIPFPYSLPVTLVSVPVFMVLTLRFIRRKGRFCLNIAKKINEDI